MSGLVNGLQNRLRRFESARHLTDKLGNLDKKGLPSFLFITLIQQKFLYHFRFKCPAHHILRKRTAIDIFLWIGICHFQQTMI